MNFENTYINTVTKMIKQIGIKQKINGKYKYLRSQYWETTAKSNKNKIRKQKSKTNS